MLAATRAEAIAEAEKVLLVDALQNPQHRLLDDLVLQGSDAQRPLATIWFRNPARDEKAMLGRLLGEYGHGGPRYWPPSFAHSRATLPHQLRPLPLLQVEERFGQTVFVDVMQQGREFERAVLSGSFTHAVQST